MSDAIVAEGLVKRFGDAPALDGLDLTVAEGTVLGLLGPNGAGKTTTVKILSTLWRPDAGRALVAGVDVVADPARVRRRIGLAGQFSAVDYTLTGRENLVLFGRLYRLGHRQAQKRADRLLERFNLTEVGRKPVKTYSGGMIRKLDLAVSLVASPRVLFMDEPTTGLDPAGRLELYDLLEEQVRGGMTLLLTSQYLEEVDRLASQIAVVARGKVIALGTADELKGQVGGDRVDVTLADPGQVSAAVAALRALASGEPAVDVTGTVVGVPTASSTIAAVVRVLDREGIGMQDISIHRPTLDDVFLKLTGASTYGVAAWTAPADAASGHAVPAGGAVPDVAAVAAVAAVPAVPAVPAVAAVANPADGAEPAARAPAAPAVAAVAIRAAVADSAARAPAEAAVVGATPVGETGAVADAAAPQTETTETEPAVEPRTRDVAAPVPPAPAVRRVVAVVSPAPSRPSSPLAERMAAVRAAAAARAEAPAAVPPAAPPATVAATAAETGAAESRPVVVAAPEPAPPAEQVPAVPDAAIVAPPPHGNGPSDPVPRRTPRRSHRAGPAPAPTPDQIVASPTGAHAVRQPAAPWAPAVGARTANGHDAAEPAVEPALPDRRRPSGLPASWLRDAADPDGHPPGSDATDPHAFVLTPADPHPGRTAVDPAPGPGRRRRAAPDPDRVAGRPRVDQ